MTATKYTVAFPPLPPLKPTNCGVEKLYGRRLILYTLWCARRCLPVTDHYGVGVYPRVAIETAEKIVMSDEWDNPYSVPSLTAHLLSEVRAKLLFSIATTDMAPLNHAYQAVFIATEILLYYYNSTASKWEAANASPDSNVEEWVQSWAHVWYGATTKNAGLPRTDTVAGVARRILELGEWYDGIGGKLADALLDTDKVGPDHWIVAALLDEHHVNLPVKRVQWLMDLAQEGQS